jgi:hypothetical protein
MSEVMSKGLTPSHDEVMSKGLTPSHDEVMSKGLSKGLTPSHDEVMSDVEKYFINNFIPYKKNVSVFKNDELLTIFDFVVPYGIIKVKYSSPVDSKGRIKEGFHETIDKQLNNIPEDCKYYLYVMKGNEIINGLTSNKVNIITSLDQFKYYDIPHYIDRYTILRMIAQYDNEDLEFITNALKNCPIYITKNVYYRNIAVLSPEQLDKLKGLNIIFLDEDKQITDVTKIYALLSYINGDTDAYISEKTTFSIFHQKIKKQTKNDTIFVKMKIEGVTDSCKICNRLMMVDNLTDKSCNMGQCYASRFPDKYKLCENCKRSVSIKTILDDKCRTCRTKHS